MKVCRMGTLFSLEITARRSALLGFVLMWGILAALAFRPLGLPAAAALAGGAAAALLHFVSEFIHQLGHALAAQSTGHPMQGIRFWWVFGTSLYPPDEGKLPAAVHLRRALGGAPLSLVVAVAAGVAVSALQPGIPAFWVAAFTFLDNLFVFALGAFLPLGFTDGSTLLRLWRER